MYSRLQFPTQQHLRNGCATCLASSFASSLEPRSRKLECNPAKSCLNPNWTSVLIPKHQFGSGHICQLMVLARARSIFLSFARTENCRESCFRIIKFPTTSLSHIWGYKGPLHRAGVMLMRPSRYQSNVKAQRVQKPPRPKIEVFCNLVGYPPIVGPTTSHKWTLLNCNLCKENRMVPFHLDSHDFPFSIRVVTKDQEIDRGLC